MNIKECFSVVDSDERAGRCIFSVLVVQNKGLLMAQSFFLKAHLVGKTFSDFIVTENLHKDTLLR